MIKTFNILENDSKQLCYSCVLQLRVLEVHCDIHCMERNKDSRYSLSVLSSEPVLAVLYFRTCYARSIVMAVIIAGLFGSAFSSPSNQEICKPVLV